MSMRWMRLQQARLQKILYMNYQGLVNEGSTCYLNSLIQTLFMTYQFRKNVYAYVHDPKKIQQKDSIPYQLQKLFVNLQTSQHPCYSKGLLKSFQWTEAEAFQQHDVQQFCRILFDAIEASHKNTLWIKELFGFLMNSVIDCGKHRSLKTQEYLDISLPVKNIFSRKNYNSVQECLKQYFMPETMQGVECSGCQAKVQVKKGIVLQSLPSILTIQLNRFELNYQTFQRQKINSFLYYPELLELNRFIKPYDQIELKSIPKGLQQKRKFIPQQKSKRTVDLSIGVVSQYSKKRRGSDDKIIIKEHVSYLDEQNRNKRGPEVKQLSQQQQKNRNLQILASLKQDKFVNLQKAVKRKKEEVPPAVSQQQDMLFDTLAQGYSFSNPTEQYKMAQYESGAKPSYQSGVIHYEHEEQQFDRNKQYADGVYALYAVLIHSGGSYGGHYYAYISDGDDWFKFDDSKVSKVNRTQMRKYGSNEQTTNGTNAYLLFYRKTSTFRPIKSIQIPIQLIQKVSLSNKLNEVQQKKLRQRQLQRQKRNLQMEQSLLVKIYLSDKDEPISIKIENKGKQTVRDLKDRVRLALVIEQRDENWRMRRYNKQDNSLHEVYDRQLLGSTLQVAGFRQYVTIGLQFKQDAQAFDDYDPNKIVIKVNVWQKDIIMMSQKLLRPHKIYMHLSQTYGSLHEAIGKSTKIENLLVIKRNYMGLCPISVISLQENRSKQLIELRFFNNLNLYVQENTETVKPKWAQQFQNQKFRCFIKYNNPRLGQARDQQIYFDSRRTLGQLKKAISQSIGIDEENFRLKKGKQLPELTTFKKRLSDLRFINNQILYIQQGRSSQGSVTMKRGNVQLIDGQIDFMLHEEIQIELTSQMLTVEHLCEAIGLQTGLPQQQIRIRQYLAAQFREIYARNDLIQRIRHKNLVWQFTQGQQARGYQVYFRVFDVMTFELGPLRQLFIQSNATYEQFCLLLQQELGIQHNKILVHKSINHYIDKSVLFDGVWVEPRYLPGTVKESPLDIRCDGQVLVIREAEEAYRPSSKAVRKAQNSREGGEAKLKITVIVQNDIQPDDIQRVIVAYPAKGSKENEN